MSQDIVDTFAGEVPRDGPGALLGRRRTWLVVDWLSTSLTDSFTTRTLMTARCKSFMLPSFHSVLSGTPGSPPVDRWQPDPEVFRELLSPDVGQMNGACGLGAGHPAELQAAI
jgi:hypothetical protein